MDDIDNEIQEVKFHEPKRAKRIRKRRDKIRRARNKYLERYWYFNCNNPSLRLAEAEANARRTVDNLKVCSCDVCCNGRRSGWSSGKFKFTMQEIRNDFYKKHKKMVDSDE